MNAGLVVRNIGELWTTHHLPPVRGAAMNDVTVLKDAFIAVNNGLIVGFGSGSGDAFVGPVTEIRDACRMVLTPGLVDGHTHLVHAGSREHEFALKLQGVPYLEILKRGGGILSTVAATRAASFDELYDQARKSLLRMLAFGVTTVEAKSGYGLEPKSERKILKVIEKLNETQAVTLIPTAMGAHAIPAEYAFDREGYVATVLADLETIRLDGLAESVDVFCEAGVFTVSETKRILMRAKELGFAIRVHADEIVSTGGAGLAAELGCASADHLMAINDKDILALAGSDTVANLLPGTSFYLGHDYAPARRLIAANIAVGIASDYNPGSCPSENFQFTLQLAANQMKMTPSEVLTAATINPGYHLGKSDRIGSIAIGKDADFVLFDVPNFDYVLYHFGVNLVVDVYKKGRRVIADGRLVKE
ncbi:MAG TPA: imidazolonepropionase [Acholeplasmatales bacterium]|nr:MAG: imidazolonepropionase [Tenericutes bacterium GWF2_57_13]HAQ56004.1 imidazolonepropionase [Acholeplasmatales bacterium]